MTLTQAMQSPFRQTTYTEQEEEQIRKRVEESVKQKIDAMAPVRGKQETVEVNNQTFKVDSLDTVQQKNNLQAQKAVELSTPLLEKQEENTEPLDTTPFANKNYSYKDVENFAEEQGMSMEQANENAVKLIKENPVGTLAQNTATTNAKIWKGLNEDFMSFDAYDYERKEQTDQQKAWESFVRSAKEARSTDELMLTQGQKLGEFRTKATELTDILWNMYSSAGSTKKVDRVYGATLDAYLSAFFGKPISEIANNREKYKTLVMGRNVDDVSTLEAMGRAFQSDSLSTRIAMNEWMYFITKDSRYQDNVDELSKVQQRFYTDYADRNKVSEMFINSMPILAQGLKMWATLMVTGGIGSAIGSAVGLKKALGEAVTASLYASLGQKIGVGVGYGISAMDTFMREGGSAMVELSQLRDSWGNKLDDDLILKAGILTGLVNTFWEYLTPEPFTKKMTSFNFKSVLKSGFASTLSNVLLNSLAGGISESTEELLQTASSDALSWVFKKLSNEYDGTTFDLSEDSLYNWLADGIKSFGQAFFPSMLAGLAGTGRAYVQDVITNVITNEDYRKNFKTEALRTLDTYTTPENSTYNFRKEAETNQVVPSRNSRIVSEFGISIEGGKLSKEERQQIREKYENEDGKMPAIVVRWDSEKRMYTPIDEENNKIAQYLYSDKRAKGFVVEYRNAESVQYPSSTVSILTRNNRGSFDQTNSTITFDTSRDREIFLTNFEGEIMTDLDDSTTELKIKNDKGEDITYTVKLSKVNQDNTGFDSSQTKQEDTNTTNNVRTKKVQDQNGNVYEVFDKSDVLDMLTYALPSMSEREASTIAEWINLLPANIQDSIIQKLKKSNGDIRDFIISADDYAMENNYNPELMKKLERGRAIALINEARIVLKDGKTRGKDVVHEVFHVLWNLFPEYRSDLVKGVTTTLNDTASREQLKRWYEDNRDALNSLKGNKFKNETVGKVNSWESFLSLLETVSDEKVEADIKSGNPAIEELFARMSTVILIDPSEGAMNSLPATLRDIFKKIVQKLKSLYKGLIGEFNNRNFAPRTLEDAVLSIYQNDNTYTATDNLNQRVRYSEEFDDKYKDIVDEYTSIMHLALSTMNMTTEQKDKTRIKLRKMLGLSENGDISVNQITYALSKYYKEIAGERDFGDYKNPNNVSLFSNILTKEIKDRVKVAPENSAVGWYSEKIDLMHSIVGEAFPEINSDPNGAGFIFDVLVAMTSQGQTVEQNFDLAINAYESYKKTGLLPTDAGNGIQANATNNNIGKINAMLLGGMSIEDIRQFFEKQWTGAELRDRGYDVATNMEEKDYGSIILGPKIGGAFFSNIRGNHEIPTLDKWMSRVLFPFTGYTYNKKILGSEKDAIGFETFTNPDRKFFLDVANDVRKKLKRNPNFKGITVADIQAVLWYNIKTLYDAVQKQASTSLGTDYATASAKVFAIRNANELGLTGKKRTEWINDEIQRLVDGAKHRRVQERVQNEGRYQNLGSTGMDTNLSEILPDEGLGVGTQALGETFEQGGVAENRQISEGTSSSNSSQRYVSLYNDGQRHEADLSRRRGDLASVPRVLPWWQSGTRSVYGLGVRNSSFLTEVKTFINNDGSKTYNPVRIIPFTDNSFVRVAYSQEMFVGRELADYISVNTDGHVALPDDISFLEISRDKNGKTYSAGSYAFVTAMNKAVENLKAQDKGRNLTVDVPTVNDINNGNYKLYLSSDGKAGFALHGDEIKAVFADPSFVGASYMIMPMAIALGGRRLDCFDGKVGLQNVYARFGFKPVARIEFSYDAFSDNATKRAWKKQVDNLGKPDVYFMVLDKNTLLSNPNFQKEGFVPSPEEIPLIKGENNYSEALQKAEDIAKATASDFDSDMNLVTYKANFVDTNSIYATRDQIESSLNETNDRFESLFRYSEELEGGYDNTAHMSNRAVRAYENSEMPISKWNGQTLDEAIEYTSDASQEVIDILKSLPVEAKRNLLKWSSWHHTGIFFNETDFYTIGDLSDVSVKDAETYRDEWNQYKKDKREYPKKIEEIKSTLKENQELKESYSGKMQIVTYENAFENVSIPSSISEFASNSLEYSRSGNAYKMFQKPHSEDVKNGLERLEISEDGKTISLTKYNADKKAYETIDSINLPIETTTEELHDYLKGNYKGSVVSKEDVDIKEPYAPYLYHTEEVRYSEELEDDDTQDYGDTFNVDNPKSIINRNIRTWDALVDSDVDQFIAQDVYLPTEVLKQHDTLKSVQQEIEDRNEIDLHLEIYPQIRDIASESKTVGEFIQRVKKDVYSTNLTDNDERILRKYYNYSQTLSPTDFLSWFTEMYANEKQTTLEDLLALKKVMGIRREAKVTSDGKRVYTVVANDTRLSKVLSQIDKNSTDADVKKVANEIKRRAGGYMKDLARTLLRSEKASALKNTSFNPVTSSWLAIALGSSQEDAYQAHLKADSTSSEMNDATSSSDTSDTILRNLNNAFKLNANEAEDIVKNIQNIAKSNPFLKSLVELGNLNPKEVSVTMLVRAINKLEEQIDTEVLSKDDYRNRYNLLRGEVKKLNKENREQLAQINSLFKEAVGYLDKIDDYKANYKRLQKLLMYTQLFAKLDQKTLKAYYKEILARNSARTSLRNAMSYNSSTYDAYHIDPVMKYLYKFIHNTDKTFTSVSENEYVNSALKRGEAIDSREVAFTTYDYVDLFGNDMQETEVLYNPNSPRIDLTDMPAVLENALPVELANAMKRGELTFYGLDSKSLNQIRSALAIAKQLSKMSKKEKDSVRGTRRRNRAMSIFNGQYNLDVKNMSTDMRNSIIDKMNADPNYRKSSLMYSDEELEDYIRKNPRAVFSAMADDDKGVMRKLYDAVGPSYMKMQRVAEWMDGKANGPIYNEFFRPLFESYEQKMRWVNKRQAEAGNSIRTILGDGNATDKKTIRANKKLLEQEEVLKNNTVNDGEATIKVNGWDKIGIYIYSKNIFGFIKLISSSGNNIALEEVAKINPEYTKRFIELALAQREQNELVKRGLTNREIWKESTKNDGTDYYARDILNHVSLETLEDVLSKLNSGEIPMTSSINGISTKLGDELIRLVSARQSEVVKAGYDEYNMLTILQDNYFPLVALDDNLFRIEEQNSKSRVSRGLLMRRQMTDTYALSLNPLANFYKAISNQEALINMASTIDDMHWLMDARGGNLKGIISQKFGTAWGKYFEEYLNAMAGAGDRNLSDLGKLANKFIGNIAVSRIGANLMVSAKQLISTIPAMTQGELTPWEVLNALGKLTGNKKESWKQFIEQQSPSTFYSAYNIEAENARKFDETMANDSVMSDLRETTMWLTEKLDGLTKGAIWIAKYQKEIDSGASVQDASFRATQLVQTTQSITDTPSLSQLQRNKNPLVRVAFMFTNDLFQTWNTVTRDVQMFKDKETRGRAIKELLGIALSNAVLAFLAGGWLKDDDDDDDENTMFADFLKDWGVEFFNDIPVVGQVFDISGYDSNYYTGFDKAKNLFDMFSNQATYWKTNGKKGKDYEAGDYADKLFNLVMEGGLSLTGAPVTTMERGYKSVFPNGMAEGITKSPTSFYYMLGSRWGKSLFMDK